MEPKSSNRLPPEHRRAAVLAAIDNTGTTLDKIAKVCHFEHIGDLRRFVRLMMLDGLICSCRTKPADSSGVAMLYVFTDMAARDAFHKAAKDAIAERAKQTMRERDAARFEARKEAKNAARRAKLIAKPPKPPKGPKPRAEPKPRNAKIVKSKPATSLPRQRAEKPAPVRFSPATLPGDPDTSRAKIVSIEWDETRSRHYVDPATISGGFAALKPGQYAFEPASCAAQAVAA